MRAAIVRAVIVGLASASLTEAMSVSYAPTLSERLQAAPVVIRGRVVGVKRVDSNQVVRSARLDSLRREPPAMFEYEVIADRVFKGCVRPGGRVKIWQSNWHIAGTPQIGKGDTSLLMLRGADDQYYVYYEIPLRNQRLGFETEFRGWIPEVFEARIDSIIATQPGDSVLSDKNQTLLPDFGSITGQVVARFDGTLHVRKGIQVVMDNGRASTTNESGRFQIEGRAGTHVLTFPGTTIKPKKVRIPAGCFDFVRITAPR